MQSHVFTQILARPRHGVAQLERFDKLPDEAETTSYVAECILGLGRSTIDRLRREGTLQTVKRGRSVRISVGSIRRALATK